MCRGMSRCRRGWVAARRAAVAGCRAAVADGSRLVAPPSRDVAPPSQAGRGSSRRRRGRVTARRAAVAGCRAAAAGYHRRVAARRATVAGCRAAVATCCAAVVPPFRSNCAPIAPQSRPSTRRPAATDTEIGMPWAAVLGPKERGPVSLPEAVLPEADGSVG